MKVSTRNCFQKLFFTFIYYHLFFIDCEIFLAGTQRPVDVPLWSYIGRDVLDYNKTKMGRIRFLIYFAFVVSGLHLALGNTEKFS